MLKRLLCFLGAHGPEWFGSGAGVSSSKSMVEVREIAQESEETGFMSGKCIPVPGKYIGEPLRKRVLQNNRLDIHGGFGYAHPAKQINVAPGVKVFSSSYWSNYA